MWTKIRLLLEEQSDLGPICLSVSMQKLVLDVSISIFKQQMTSADDIFSVAGEGLMKINESLSLLKKVSYLFAFA